MQGTVLLFISDPLFRKVHFIEKEGLRQALEKWTVPRERIPRFPFQIHIKREAIAVSFKCDSSHSNLCYYGTKLHVRAREIGRADKEDSWDLLSYLYFTHMLFHFPPTPVCLQDPGWLFGAAV